ncbi:hypothetical protein [Bifidobacterium phasiani]|uniref:Protein kinase domain-containing protein n=1 Tax=Bifidobacterium phasiani TaxID=2834431 RepID=A0ABS6W802_9BIFI|nr:hypothetical protein [Bifidobacterium phasiani]MBW3082629.1 hypothetical protein [Bifidobacterium phasiani]
MTLRQLARTNPDDLTRLSRGAQATVYLLPESMRVDGHDRLVYKRYRPTRTMRGRETATLLTLEQLVGAYHGLGARPDGARIRGMLDHHAAWPLATVAADDGTVGVVERRVDARFLGGPNARDAEVAHLERWVRDPSQDAMLVRDGLHPLGDEGRARIVTQLLAYYSLVHRLGFVVGDISLRNVLAYVPERRQGALANVGFIEVDTYRRQGCGCGIAQGTTPGFDVPESVMWQRRAGQARREDERRFARAMATVQTERTDVYKAALLVLRLCSCGEPFPSTVRRVRSAAQRAAVRAAGGSEALAALQGALAEDPQDRPTMHELYHAFRGGSCDGKKGGSR